MVKLTKKVVEAAEQRAAQYTLWCSELRGFGVKINTGGSRSYFVDYRTSANIRRRMVIGQHGLVTTDEARKVALQRLSDVLRGQDPKLDQKNRWHAVTMNEL